MRRCFRRVVVERHAARQRDGYGAVCPASPGSEPPSALSVPDGVPGASVSTNHRRGGAETPVPLALVAVA